MGNLSDSSDSSDLSNQNMTEAVDSSNFPWKIKTKQNNELIVNMDIINSELFIECSYEKNYVINSFTNSFSIKKLKKISPFFDMFKNVYDALKGIKADKATRREFIQKNEETSNYIELIVPLRLSSAGYLSFRLN